MVENPFINCNITMLQSLLRAFPPEPELLHPAHVLPPLTEELPPAEEEPPAEGKPPAEEQLLAEGHPPTEEPPQPQPQPPLFRRFHMLLSARAAATATAAPAMIEPMFIWIQLIISI